MAFSALTDELSLVAQARADPAAFAEIYDFYFDRVYNYVRFRVSNAQEADDLTAEIFERVLTKLDTYQPERGPFNAWLFAIARNHVNYSLRRRPWQRLFSFDLLFNKASEESRPGEVVAQAEVQQQLLAAVSRLGKREQELIALKFTSGLTNRVIADLTGLQAGNVGVILHRAVKRLRSDLEKRGINYE